MPAYKGYAYIKFVDGKSIGKYEKVKTSAFSHKFSDKNDFKKNTKYKVTYLDKVCKAQIIYVEDNMIALNKVINSKRIRTLPTSHLTTAESSAEDQLSQDSQPATKKPKLFGITNDNKEQRLNTYTSLIDMQTRDLSENISRSCSMNIIIENVHENETGIENVSLQESNEKYTFNNVAENSSNDHEISSEPNEEEHNKENVNLINTETTTAHGISSSSTIRSAVASELSEASDSLNGDLLVKEKKFKMRNNDKVNGKKNSKNGKDICKSKSSEKAIYSDAVSKLSVSSCQACSEKDKQLKEIHLVVKKKDQTIKDLQSENKKLSKKNASYKTERDTALKNAAAKDLLNIQLQEKIVEKFEERNLMEHKSSDQDNVQSTLENGLLPVGYLRKSNQMVHLGQDVWLPVKIYHGVLSKAKTPPQCVGGVVIAVFGELALLTSTISGKPSNRTKKDKNDNNYDDHLNVLDPTMLQACKDFYLYWLKTIYVPIVETQKTKTNGEQSADYSDDSDDKQSTKIKKVKTKSFNLSVEINLFYEYVRRKISYLKRINMPGTSKKTKTCATNKKSEHDEREPIIQDDLKQANSCRLLVIEKNGNSEADSTISLKSNTSDEDGAEDTSLEENDLEKH